MTKYYISIHGGEGWEDTVDSFEEIEPVVQEILDHWPRIDPKELRKKIYVFPMEARVDV